jgi:hypothetical protein
MTCALHEAVSSEHETLALDTALGGGSPLLEDPEGLVFSPLAWLFVSLSPETAASLFSWVSLVFAAAAAAWLGHSFGLSRAASTGLGVAHAVSGTSLNLVVHGPHVVGASLLPLVWAGARVARRSPQPLPGIAAVIVGLGLLPLHGAFQVAAWSALIALGEATAGWTARRRERALLIVAGVASGSMLGGLQLLASIGLREAAARASGVSNLAVWPLEAPEAFGIVLPNVATLRTAVDATLVQVWHGTRLAREGWNVSPYLGVSLALATLTVFLVLRGRLRRARPLAFVAILSLLMALGDATPVYRATLALFPPLQLFRYPAKYFQLTSLTALTLAFLVVDVAQRLPALRRSCRHVVALWSVGPLGVVALSAAFPKVLAAAESRVAGRAPSVGGSTLAEILLFSSAVAFLMALLAALVLGRPRRRGLVPLLLVTDLGCAALTGGLHVSAPWLDGSRPPAPELPPEAQLCSGRALRAIHVDTVAGPLGLEGDLLPDFVDHKLDFAQCRGPRSPHAFLSTSQSLAVRLVHHELDETAGVVGPAIALGCTHVNSRGTVPDNLLRVPQPQAPPFAAPVYALPDPLPPVGIARDPALMHDEAALLSRLRSARTAPEVASLIDDPSGSITGPLPRGHAATVAQVRFERADRGAVTLSGSGGAVVFLRRAWWPGWRAQQGSARLAVVRVAGTQLGVVVEDVTAGPVSLRYETPTLKWAVGSFLLGCVVAVVTGLCALRANVTHPRRRD